MTKVAKFKALVQKSKIEYKKDVAIIITTSFFFCLSLQRF